MTRRREGGKELEKEAPKLTKKTRLELTSEATMWTTQRCKNSRLSSIEDKLNLLLSVLPELENHKSRINQLKEENKSLQTSLQYAHAEIEDLKTKDQRRSRANK